MKPKPNTPRSSQSNRRATAFAAAVAAAAFAGLSGSAGCGPDAASSASGGGPARPNATATAGANQSGADRRESPTSRPVDRPIAAWRTDLLDLAFGAASALPVDPHVKTRCRTQEDCAAAALALHQPERALRSAELIFDWRRAAALADCAQYAADHDCKQEASRLAAAALARADEHSKTEKSQDWQRDRVYAKIARVYLTLGRPEDASKISQGLVDSEAAAVRAAGAGRSDAAGATKELDALETSLKEPGLDQARGSLAACVRIFEIHYGDVSLRTRAETLVKKGFEKLPPDLRIGFVIDLAVAAFRNGAPAHAKTLVDDAKAVVDTARWLPEDRVKHFARLAGARARTGDAAGVARDAETAIAVLDANKKIIPDFNRADVLLPVAEAYVAIGDRASALKFYRRAAEEGALNPNGRPRAEDFVALALSLAKADCEPDAELAVRMKTTRAGLAAPW